MADHPSTHWALRITATAGSDLDLAKKIALKTYQGANLFKVGAVARASHLEILNRETGQSGTYMFVGVGAGLGAGIVSADITGKWHPFDTKDPITLEEFGKHAAFLYNMSAGLGFNWAPISGIRFANIEIKHSSVWESLWHGNGISVGGATTLNAGTSLDVSEVVGKIFTISQEEGNPAVINHLDEINKLCIANGLGSYPHSMPNAPSFVLETRCFAPFEEFGGGFAGDNRGFSLAPDASARIHSKVTLQPDSASYPDPDVWSDKTKASGVPLLKGREAYSPSQMDPPKVVPIPNGAEYQLHTSGANPLAPGAPDIDLHTKISVTHPLPRVVNIEVELQGDQFPAFEAVLRDRSGKGIFLGGFMPTSSGGVWTKLFGDTQRPMGKVTLQVTLDANNNFDRTLSIKFSGPYTAIRNTVS